jgi:hypothetical protein
MDVELARLIVRHRHVAPMLSALLGGIDAAVRISDAEGTVILERGAERIGRERLPIVVEGRTVGWVEGDRTARAVASVLAYAAAREADKRSLAQEALDRYRELNLVYDLADRLAGRFDVAGVVDAALAEVGRLPGGGRPFLVLAPDGDARGAALVAADGADRGLVAGGRVGEGVVGAVAYGGEAEIVNDAAADPRAVAERSRGVASLIAAPLRAADATIGVVGVATSEPHEFRAGDLKVLTAIAALIGPAIERARANEAARRAPVG